MKNKEKVIKNELYNLDYKPSPTKDCQKYIKSYNQKKFTKHIYTDSIVRGDYCSCLISILFNTNNVENTIYSIKQFLDKAHNPEKIQFCIKIDNNNKGFVKKFLKSLEKFQCNFVILSSPRGRGYVDLWHWINYLFKVSSKKSNFVMNTSDEMYVKEKNWDINLSKYENLFDDGIFRLRTSVYKNRNYNTLWECGYAPDTTAIYSRKYLTIQGDFSPCFGPDNGQQFVAYYLSKLNYPRHYQYLRDYVVNDINFEGQGTNADMHGPSLRKRQVINYQLWNNMFKHVYQEDYYLRARKIQIAIVSEFKNMDNKMMISHNHYKKNFTVFIKDTNRENLKIILGYKINKYLYNLKLLKKLDFFKYHTATRKKYIVGLIVHYLMQHMNIHPETMLYRTKYGPYNLIKLVLVEENIEREVTLKNFIFIIIYIFGSIYFYIDNKIKREKLYFKRFFSRKNFQNSQLRRASKLFRFYYFNQYITMNKIFKINKKLSEKVNLLKLKKLLSYNRKSNVSYKFNRFKSIIEYFSLLKILYVNILYGSYNILIITIKNIYFFGNAANFLKFMYFILISPYNIFVYLLNNANFINKLCCNYILYQKKIDDTKYVKASVVALTNIYQKDQSKVIILKGDS
jgi:hypothetical protein